jgi:YD repeat-containing protein
MAMLECAKTGNRSGAAWQKVLQRFENLEFAVSDAAKGIAKGVKDVAAARIAAARAEGLEALSLGQGLDVFHTNQDSRRVLAGPWRRAEAAWEKAEAADAKVREAKQQGIDSHTAASRARYDWDQAVRLLEEVDPQEKAWQRARGALAVFRPDGTLNERGWAEQEIQAALADLQGASWQKVRNVLTDPRSLAFVDRMHQRLAEAEPDEVLRQACVRRWWLRHHRPATVVEQTATTLEQVLGLLDDVIRERPLNPIEQAAYARVSAVLATTVRASSAVEGMNSVMRMQQGRHRKMTQGLLNLKRLYWNCRKLTTGKRRNHCPYELLGVQLPTTDFWSLLKPPPADQLTQVVSSKETCE